MAASLAVDTGSTVSAAGVCRWRRFCAILIRATQSKAKAIKEDMFAAIIGQLSALVSTLTTFNATPLNAQKV